MDNSVLKKRLSTYRTDGGSITKVNDDLVIDILKAWESWKGPSREFYQGLSLSRSQLGCMIKKGKRLIKSGIIGNGDFKELKLESIVSGVSNMTGPIEILWDQGKVIRFSQVELLIEFLKKAA